MSIEKNLAKAAVWKAGAFRMPLCRPYVMGVVNATPDSFSDGGEHEDERAAIAFAIRLVEEGADIIDVGGESTRPGADPVSIEVEISRTEGIVSALANKGICVSIDTRHVQVARAAIAAGASIINDVTGFCDPEMVELAASCDAGLVTMHMRGTPQSMQTQTEYDNVTLQVRDHLDESVRRLVEAGVDQSRICVDPGPGFAKDARQTLELLSNMSAFSSLGCPLLAAFSRKSMLGAITGVSDSSRRVSSSVAAAVLSYQQGADILRVHDVRETVEALQVVTNSRFLMSGKTSLRGKRAFVALGSNMGDSVGSIVEATRALDGTDGIDVIASSSIYETEPAYYLDQGKFANSVVWIQTELGQYELLDRLFDIENDFHRKRVIANGPRTLDMDLLDYEDVVQDDPHLILPHPRVLERAFTVEPLLELSRSAAAIMGRYLSVDTLVESATVDNPMSLCLADGKRVVADNVQYGSIVDKLMDASEVLR